MRGLEIEQDAEFQRREWRMERAGWVVLAIVVIAAAAGLFGGGPVSHARASDQSGHLVIEYERFLRASAPSELHLQVFPAAATGAEVTVWADQSYLRDVEVSSIVPAPKRVEQRGRRILYVFSSNDAAEPSEITFRYEPTRAGRLNGRFGVSEGAPAEVRQFAFF